MMKSVRNATIFAVVCGVVAALLAAGQGLEAPRVAVAGLIGTIVGFLLMLALRARP